ncbi:LmeA family phospholipid-binding protein [Nocardioides mangrovicus]|uniref:LmeA family phospholipid-binding protein n=1 Tax=Nocardioides mangrovicus TaxID=2478913 RepID=UPI0013148125|nr:DUF2993 domain-containing protein [Nocardioides mangrovicus]
MSRKSIVVTIIVVIVLLVADVAAASVQNHKAADAFVASQHLPASPYVHINGWPFVLQGIRGSYRYITVQADPARTSGDADLDVHPMRLSLYGVHTHGGFADATVERATGTARIGYRSLSKGLGKRVVFAGADRISVTSKTTVDGRTYRPSVSARPEVSDGALVFHQVTTTDQKGLPSADLKTLEQIFSGRFELGRFPFGVHPTKVTMLPEGMVFRVTGHDLRLG